MWSCCCVFSVGPGSSQTSSWLFWLSSFLPSFPPSPLADSGERLRWIHPPGTAGVLQQGELRAPVAQLMGSYVTSHSHFTCNLHALCVCFLFFSGMLFLPACCLMPSDKPPRAFKTVHHLLYFSALLSVSSEMYAWMRSTPLFTTAQPDFLFFSWKSCKASWIPWLDVQVLVDVCAALALLTHLYNTHALLGSFLFVFIIHFVSLIYFFPPSMLKMSIMSWIM